MNLVRMRVDDLTPHPLHEELYGNPMADQEEMELLIRDIQANGMLNPIVVDQEMLIISGHRRWVAAKMMDEEFIMCDHISFKDETQRIRYLIAHNTYRTKSNKAKIKEAKVLEDVYRIIAKAKQAHKLPDDEEVLSTIAASDGKVVSRDEAGKAVGLSPRSYTTGKKVAEYIEELKEKGEEEKAAEVEEKLETSIQGAFNLAKKHLTGEDPQDVIYWYRNYLEKTVQVINSKNTAIRKRCNSTTPTSLLHFLDNLDAMVERIRTWYPANMVDCPVCKGTMFVDGVACTNCFQGKTGLYTVRPPKPVEEDL